MTWARPLNRLRSGFLSDSWQLGSPLPTPITIPSPLTLQRSRPLCSLNNDLGKPVEQAAFRFLIRFLAVGIAIANTDHDSFTFDLERDEGVCIGNMEPILIHGFHANDCNVLAVGRNFHAIG